MRKIKLFFACLLIAFLSIGQMWGANVVYTFNTDDGLAALGITKPDQYSGTALDDTYSIDPVSMSATDGTNLTRIWNAESTFDLRIYSGGTLTFSVSTGYYLTSVVFSGTTTNVFTVATGSTGTFSTDTWTADNTSTTSVTLRATAKGAINTITINYESTGGSSEPQLAVAYTLQLVADPIKGSVAVTNLLGSGIVDNGDGTYDVPEGAEVTLQATPNEGYEFIGWKAGSVGCDFTDCGNALSTVDNPLTFDMNNEVAFMAEFAAVAPADNSVKLYHNFSGDWMETEAFGIFDDYTSEYAKISMILEPGDYQFAVKVGGELRGNGTAFSRNKRACILGEGLTANLTLNVDVKGTYRFYWFYEENRFAMDVPNVCGMYWQDVTAGNFEVTLGKESEVTLPTVYTTNMGFAYNIFNGVDQVRLVSTDETVATIEYTLSMDGLGTVTIHKAGECDIYAVHDITDYYCYDSCAFHLTVLPAPAPQPQIGPKEVLDLGTTGCVGEHYQLTGGGTNIYRTVGGVDNKMITIESLHGEIIDNISLKLYYYNVWTGYSVAASSGDVSSWNYDAYEDLVITNINATSVTLSRVGSGQQNGYVMFEKVTINNSDEPQPQPAEDVNITPNVDPDHAGVYYSTFFDSSVKYELPAGVEAYVADLSGANLLLTKIANAGQTIPANVAVILKSTVTPFTLTVSDADAVTFTATNDLQGSDTQIATPDNCYVLAGEDGVGFYHYTASMLNPHKAYVIYSGSQAPKRMPFVFNQATGVDNVQGDKVQSTKVIENGVLYIIKNGVKYNAQGQVIK